MVVGLIGSGNMARAIARGWGEPVLCTDGGSGRADALVAELGGEVFRSNAELAERCDLVVLCHKPYQLEAVALQVAGRVPAVASVLGGTPLATLAAAYPSTAILRLLPNTPVEVRRGIVCASTAEGVDPQLEREVLDRFARLGTVVPIDEAQMDVALAVMSVAPAYWALITEAHIDAGIKGGLAAPLAAQLAIESLAGTAELLEARGGDTLTVRREVTSPGGSTARGLAALERGGVRAAFLAALDAVVGPPR